MIAHLTAPKTPVPPRHTVEDAYRIWQESGRRLELIDGEIVFMMPPGPEHAGYTDETQQLIISKVGARARVRCQHPISINRHNEPQPDIAVVALRKDGYRVSHPGPDEVLLIIEIADSSLAQDLEVKRRLYAKAEIAEYWVLDIPGRELHVFLKPWDGDYTEQRTCRDADEVQCVLIPELRLAVSELFPVVL